MKIKINKQLILERTKMNLSRAGLIGAGIGAAASAVPTLASILSADNNISDDMKTYVPGLGLTTAAAGLAMYNQNKMNQDPTIKRDIRTK